MANERCRSGLIQSGWHVGYLVSLFGAGLLTDRIGARKTGELSANTLAISITIAGLTHLAGVLGSIAGGTLSDRIGRTRVILIMSCASLACSFAFGWMLGAALWLISVVAILYSLAAIGDSSVFSTVLSETVPPSQIGFAFSVRSVLGFAWARSARGFSASCSIGLVEASPVGTRGDWRGARLESVRCSARCLRGACIRICLKPGVGNSRLNAHS